MAHVSNIHGGFLSIKDRLVNMQDQKCKGTFICFEGIDGCGKTVQASCLVQTLKRNGYDAIYTAEPSKGILGKFVHSQILETDSRLPTVLESVIFAADRFNHVETEIKPSLRKGKIIVCDRYLYSSVAYQGTCSSTPMRKWIIEINKHALKPNLAIYIDVPPEIAIHRTKVRKSIMESLETLKQVREAYLKLVEEKQLTMIDGNKPLIEVTKSVENLVSQILKLPKTSSNQF